MLRSYGDIIEQLGQPLWWDDNGVPRYRKFHPELCGVYANIIILLLIKCQHCDKHFFVAKEISSYDQTTPTPTPKRWWEWHYGDPPPHGCSGDAANSVPLRIVEFWTREFSEWRRNRTNEIAFEVLE